MENLYDMLRTAVIAYLQYLIINLDKILNSFNWEKKTIQKQRYYDKDLTLYLNLFKFNIFTT